MASQAPPPGMAPPPLTNQQPVQREAEAPVAAPQQQRQHQGYGRGGGGGRNQGRGRGNNNGRGGGRGRGGGEGRGGGSNGPTSVAPTSGIPYGHVPAYLPGSSSLVEELDTRVLIVLRDGRHIVGVRIRFHGCHGAPFESLTLLLFVCLLAWPDHSFL
eukprot:scaffold1184_cov132-Cylindrotheca_fusiformis.AAC.79